MPKAKAIKEGSALDPRPVALSAFALGLLGSAVEEPFQPFDGIDWRGWGHRVGGWSNLFDPLMELVGEDGSIMLVSGPTLSDGVGPCPSLA